MKLRDIYAKPGLTVSGPTERVAPPEGRPWSS
jgi:hypothetical protein